MALAARGACNMDAGEEAITDPSRREALRRKAAGIHQRAALVAALATALVLLAVPRF